MTDRRDCLLEGRRRGIPDQIAGDDDSSSHSQTDYDADLLSVTRESQSWTLMPDTPADVDGDVDSEKGAELRKQQRRVCKGCSGIEPAPFAPHSPNDFTHTLSSLFLQLSPTTVR